MNKRPFFQHSSWHLSGALLTAILLGSCSTGTLILTGEKAKAPKVVERRREVVVVEKERHGPPPWAPAHGWRRKHETYHYYPAIQVYYYPHTSSYYWLESGKWKIGGRLPERYVVTEHEVVMLELDYEPHTRHADIKKDYPPDRFGKGKSKKTGKW